MTRTMAVLALLLFFFPCSFLSPPLMGAYSTVSGKWSADRFLPTVSVQEHYDLGYQFLYKNEWDDALTQFLTVVYHFDESPFYADALFYSAICYYFKADFDLSNKQFSLYLAQPGKLKHFEKVFDFKFHIAEHYREGRLKHLFGLQVMPKMLPGKADALKIYDEITAALPGKEISASALYSKGLLLRDNKEYRESIEAFQTLTRRFSKHSLAADSFVAISEVYLDQSKAESQNPDLIALSQVNLQKFRKSFPSDERVEVTKQNILAMKEVYAKSLYDTGRFYERKKKPYASAIYYRDALYKYPETTAAQKSSERLSALHLEGTKVLVKK